MVSPIALMRGLRPSSQQSAAVLAALGVDKGWVLDVFAVISVASLLWLRRFAVLADTEPSGAPVGASRYADATRVVTADIGKSSAGRVRVETESWRALATTDDPIAIGTKVRVTEVRGNALIVECLGDPGS